MLKLKLQYFGHLMQRADLLEKTLMLGKDWRQEEKGTTEDEMAGWHHWLYGHEFEQALRVGDGQGGLACCSPWGHKESDTTERLNWTEPLYHRIIFPNFETFWATVCNFRICFQISGKFLQPLVLCHCLFMPVTVNLFACHLLSTCCMPDIVLGTF